MHRVLGTFSPALALSSTIGVVFLKFHMVTFGSSGPISSQVWVQQKVFLLSSFYRSLTTHFDWTSRGRVVTPELISGSGNLVQ